ncbi:MAG: hypothetical protein Q8N51_18035 [Gammaproteobacteria bacterium]|nr:hypothetical protein [Gammaproteobacteria bacterium]
MHTFVTRHHLFGALLPVVALLSATNPALADLTESSASENWFNTGTWSNGIPTTSDFARVVGHSIKIGIPGAGASFVEIRSGDISLEKSGDLLAPLFGSLAVANELSIGAFGFGSFTMVAGSSAATGGAAIGKGDGGTGYASVDGSVDGSGWTNYGAFFVGVADSAASSGQLQISNGGRVTSLTSVSNGTGFSIGSGLATGIVTVDNSLLTTDSFLKIGDGGEGTLLIRNGGTVQAHNGSIGYGNGSTSSGTGSVGAVTVDSGTWNNTGALDVGTYAKGSLLLSNGSTLTSSSASIGFATSGIGSVDIYRSTWTTGDLFVGLEGSGKLEIHNGAVVTSGTGIIGRYGEASGRVIVDHATWTNNGALSVANGVEFFPGHAVGTLEVRNGGTVTTSSDATIGSWTGSEGRATVKGVATDSTHSTWSIAGDLYVGDRGLGTLTIEDGGIVRSRSTFVGYFAGPPSHLNLNSGAAGRGILETSQVSNGTGAGPHTSRVTFDGGVLRATADQADMLRNFGTADVLINNGGAFIDTNGHDIGIATPMQGNGGLTKTGGGTLDLTGDSIYGGLTTVDAGKLLVNGTVSGGALVGNGATLGGSGTILGLVTVAPGGILSPGNSPGTLTMGSLVLGENSTLVIDVGTSGDQLIVNGDVTLNGVLNLLGEPGLTPEAVFRSFILYTGTLTNNGLRIGVVPEGLSADQFTLDFSTAGVVGVSSVPLPATWILLVTGLACLRRFAGKSVGRVACPDKLNNARRGSH